MREILFRGKRKDNGKWIEGGVCQTEGYTIILTFEDFEGTLYEPPSSELYDIEVIPETVGQYTGLTDKNGKMIFEGDICSFIDFHSGSDVETYCEGEWKYDDGQFYITNRLSSDMPDYIFDGEFDGYIIGNIHDKAKGEE